jgi:Fur family transcriptional regulator, ferric uptake regulator
MSCLTVLKQKGMRLTPQRRLIVELIHDKVDHLTAEDIIKRVHSRMPGVNKSTIYRTLELLVGSGCVYKSELDDRVIYHHAEEGHHHHLVCERCGRTIECDEDIAAPLEKSLEKRYGFDVHLQHLVMTGLCRTCRKGPP